VLVEAHDEWQVADKRYLSETTLVLLNISEHSTTNPLPSRPRSRHIETTQSLRRNAIRTYTTSRDTTATLTVLARLPLYPRVIDPVLGRVLDSPLRDLAGFADVPIHAVKHAVAAVLVIW